MASNAWDTFIVDLQDNSFTGAYDLMAKNKAPSLEPLTQFIFLARSCKIATEKVYADPAATEELIQPYLVRPVSFLDDYNPKDTGKHVISFLDTPYKEAVEHSAFSPIRIVFGTKIDEETVEPTCGVLELPALRASSEGDLLPGQQVQELYYDLLKDIWKDDSLTELAYCMASNQFMGLRVASVRKACENVETIKKTLLPNKMNEYRKDLTEKYETLIFEQEMDPDSWKLSAYMMSKGWAGAALWYKQIADMNGQVSQALSSVPGVVSFPAVMEYVAAEKQKIEENIAPKALYDPRIRGSEYLDFRSHPRDEKIAYVLSTVFALFNIDNDFSKLSGTGQNFFYEAIDLIFGAGGLYDIRENANVNPLAQLSALGKGIMDASIRNVFVGAGGSLISRLFSDVPKDAIGQVSTAVQQIGYTAITIGFGLYYILPILPFVYFFFAFSGWVKSIFEAIVAMPLWAMAHITRWDGEGVAGPAASQGYFLLLEIVLRPILILFGLLASISIFSALVMVLNDIFDIIIESVGGSKDFTSFDKANVLEGVQSGVDSFFYTVVYTVLCYMLATSSFKLIDQIPDKLLRWMGFEGGTFSEQNPGAAQELQQKAYQGMTISTSKLSGMTMSGAQVVSF